MARKTTRSSLSKKSCGDDFRPNRLQDSSSDEEESAASASEWDAASELTEEIDSDYEAEEARPQPPPPPAPAPRRAKRKLGE